MSSRTHRQKPGHIYIQGGIFCAAKYPGGLLTLQYRQKDLDLESGQKKTEAVREASCYLWLSSCMSGVESS